MWLKRILPGLFLATSAFAFELDLVVEGPILHLSWPGQSPNAVYNVLRGSELNSLNTWPPAAVGLSSNSWSTTDDSATQFFRVESIDRGLLLETNLLGVVTAAEITASSLGFGFTTPASFDVAYYQIAYQSVDVHGRALACSGAFALPLSTSTHPLVSFQHGTLVRADEAPSDVNSFYTIPGFILAGHGYHCVLPDFPGLGTAADGSLHPFMISEANAISVVDGLRAAEDLLEALGRADDWNDQLFLAGYSQGGQVTLAAQRLIEAEHPEYAVTASAPMAGPYDLSGTMLDTMLNTNQTYGAPWFLPYVLFSYQEAYGLYSNVADVLLEPYATDLPPLFDHQHGSGAIDAVMPTIPALIFKPEYLLAVKHNPNHPLRQALQANDLLDWAPQAPTQLYHCAADELVPVANSQVALNAFQLNGAPDVSLIDPSPTSGHSGNCITRGLVDAKLWFDTLRQ
jgi:pimeloyl-ACP methyl ester carboxylesterase